LEEKRQKNYLSSASFCFCKVDGNVEEDRRAEREVYIPSPARLAAKESCSLVKLFLVTE
jgi:hypothetical protein